MKPQFARWALTAAIAAAAVFSGNTASHAAPLGGLTRNIAPAPKHLVARRNTIAPFAFVKFCQKQAAQCQKRGEARVVELTGAKRAVLQRINVQVNSEIRYSNDAGAGDDWKIAAVSGDCEDYALTKRQRLLAAGWPSGALRIATARTPSGAAHAVLVVTTSAGDLVLDNRTNVVKPWFATQLRWVKIQSPDNPSAWLAL